MKQMLKTGNYLGEENVLKMKKGRARSPNGPRGLGALLHYHSPLSAGQPLPKTEITLLGHFLAISHYLSLKPLLSTYA